MRSSRLLSSLLACAVILAIFGFGFPAPVMAEEWETRRELISYPYVAGSTRDRRPTKTVVGQIKVYRTAKDDTFVDIARRKGLGYNELILANPGVDPWVVGKGTPITLPAEWVLPNTAHLGLVLNVPEMRLYYFKRKGGVSTVLTYPVGLGRQDWQTPLSRFRIRGKTVNPTWVIPESIRKEMIEEDGFAPYSIAGGGADNPLGKYRIELTLPSYAIHSTNKEYGIGMPVSHGCVRMYPEDMAVFFSEVGIGAQGRFVYQTAKVGLDRGRVVVEIHPDLYEVGVDTGKAARDELKRMGLWKMVDPLLLRAALEAQSGIPTDVGIVANLTVSSATP